MSPVSHPSERTVRWLLTLIATCLITSPTNAQASEITRAVEFARVDGHSLRLDLYHPGTVEPPKLIVWVHGGAWRAGSRTAMPLGGLVDAGYAIASVDYRLSPVAPFPAQIHDIKAAIRFLRAHGSQWNLNTERIAIAGASAGGHLAALVGTSNQHSQLEGRGVGDHPDRSSDVHAIISFYGASNLSTILQQSTPHGLSVRVPALELLLGNQPDQVPEIAQLASPVAHVDATDPPLLLIHGDQDPQMPINQSHELTGRYKHHHLPVEFEVVYGGAHGGKAFYDEARIALATAFLRQHF